jgi:two-component system, OmpR family, response regulator VicR
MRVTCDGDGVRLTRKEFEVLSVLVLNDGRVATRQQILDQVWGYNHYGDGRTLDVHIRRLRAHLGSMGDRNCDPVSDTVSSVIRHQPKSEPKCMLT